MDNGSKDKNLKIKLIVGIVLEVASILLIFICLFLPHTDFYVSIGLDFLGLILLLVGSALMAQSLKKLQKNRMEKVIEHVDAVLSESQSNEQLGQTSKPNCRKYRSEVQAYWNKQITASIMFILSAILFAMYMFIPTIDSLVKVAPFDFYKDIDYNIFAIMNKDALISHYYQSTFLPKASADVRTIACGMCNIFFLMIPFVSLIIGFTTLFSTLRLKNNDKVNDYLMLSLEKYPQPTKTQNIYVLFSVISTLIYLAIIGLISYVCGYNFLLNLDKFIIFKPGISTYILLGASSLCLLIATCQSSSTPRLSLFRSQISRVYR